jgi:predicted nucleic-acid-binding Zn-ribbon protein
MAESRKCPKCSGEMMEGALQKIGNFGNPPYVFAPANEPPIPVKGAVSLRKGIVLFRCERCGFTEMYAP